MLLFFINSLGRQKVFFRRFIILATLTGFVLSSVYPVQKAYAASLDLPQPGSMVNLSPAYQPVLIKGLKVHPENPFLFDFILDPGNSHAAIKPEATRLIKYFLASLTIPEKDLWVNLSPYEKDRIIPSNLGQTQMGEDMLAEDYILKQLTASLIYPEKNLGRTFWDEVYTKAQRMYGTTQIPLNTFNKVWIVADKADVYERGNVAYVVGAHLKVMLEEDYLSLQKHHGQPASVEKMSDTFSNVSSQIIRQIILPLIEKEVNEGKNFANLRQMFYSMILASWYKMALKDALLTQIYGNQSKVKVGINQRDPKANEAIFQRYLQAYKKGVFNYIKEDINEATNERLPRKYFSGGEQMWPKGLSHAQIVPAMPKDESIPDNAVIVEIKAMPQKLVAVNAGMKSPRPILNGFSIVNQLLKSMAFKGTFPDFRWEPEPARNGSVKVFLTGTSTFGSSLNLRIEGALRELQFDYGRMIALVSDTDIIDRSTLREIVDDKGKKWFNIQFEKAKLEHLSPATEYHLAFLDQSGRIIPSAGSNAMTTKIPASSKLDAALVSQSPVLGDILRPFDHHVDGISSPEYLVSVAKLGLEHQQIPAFLSREDQFKIVLEAGVRSNTSVALRSALAILELEYDLSGYLNIPVPGNIFDHRIRQQALEVLEQYLVYLETGHGLYLSEVRNDLILWLLEHPGAADLSTDENFKRAVHGAFVFFEEDFTDYFVGASKSKTALAGDYLQMLKMAGTMMKWQNNAFVNRFLELAISDRHEFYGQRLRPLLISGLDAGRPGRITEAQAIAASAIWDDRTQIFEAATRRDADELLARALQHADIPVRLMIVKALLDHDDTSRNAREIRMSKVDEQIRRLMGREYVVEVNRAVHEAEEIKAVSMDGDHFDHIIVRMGSNYQALLDQYHFQLETGNSPLRHDQIEISLRGRTYRIRTDDLKFFIADALAHSDVLGEELVEMIRRSVYDTRFTRRLEEVRRVREKFVEESLKLNEPPVTVATQPMYVEPQAMPETAVEPVKVRPSVRIRVLEYARKKLDRVRRLLNPKPKPKKTEEERALELDGFFRRHEGLLKSPANSSRSIKFIDRLLENVDSSIRLLNRGWPLGDNFFQAQRNGFYNDFDIDLLVFIAQRFKLIFGVAPGRQSYSIRSSFTDFRTKAQQMEMFDEARELLINLRQKIDALQAANINSAMKVITAEEIDTFFESHKASLLSSNKKSETGKRRDIAKKKGDAYSAISSLIHDISPQIRATKMRGGQKASQIFSISGMQPEFIKQTMYWISQKFDLDYKTDYLMINVSFKENRISPEIFPEVSEVLGIIREKIKALDNAMQTAKAAVSLARPSEVEEFVDSNISLLSEEKERSRAEKFVETLRSDARRAQSILRAQGTIEGPLFDSHSGPHMVFQKNLLFWIAGKWGYKFEEKNGYMNISGKINWKFWQDRNTSGFLEVVDHFLEDLQAEIASRDWAMKGGIDFNGAHMRMNVHKEGAGVGMQFNPAMIARIRQEGFDGIDFQIQSILPAKDLRLLLGLK